MKIPNVFSNTTNESLEILSFVKSLDNIIWLNPEMSFKDIIKTIGIPIISKKVSMMLDKCNNPTGNNENTINLYRTGIKRDGSKTNHFKIPKKYMFLLDMKFPATQDCCNILKKDPMKKYEKETGRHSIVATMAEESLSREASYIITGCNNYNANQSKPMSIWKEEDIWNYIKSHDVNISDIYKDKYLDISKEYKMYLQYIFKNDIKIEENKILINGDRRSGCSLCGFGIHLEQGINRFNKIALRTPKKYYSLFTLKIKDNYTYYEIFNNILKIKLLNPEIVLKENKGILTFEDLINEDKQYFINKIYN